MKNKTDVEMEFERAPAEFMAKYAVYPTDYVGVPPNVYDKSVKSLAVDDKLTIERRLNMIAFARLEEMPFNSLSVKKNAFAAKFHSAQAAAGHEAHCLPMWFLPWWSNAITSMTIPPKLPARNGQPASKARDPDFFFTASINGCSVFVHGSPKAPTVSHAGTADPRATKPYEVTPVFKDGLMTGEKLLTPNADFFPNGNARQHWSAVHERHFGRGTQASAVHTNDYKNYLGTENTPQALEYEKFLKDSSGRELRIDEVQSSGCVFGMRDAAGDWSFYLQKNIEVKITKLRKKKGFLQKTSFVPNVVPTGRMLNKNYGKGVVQEAEMIEQQLQMSIPIQVMKFFPGQRSADSGTAMLEKNTVRAIVQQQAG